MEILKDMLNDKSLSEAKLGKTIYVNTADLKENEFNKNREIKDVELLAENILSLCLQQPLVVKPENDKYVIITGHRRYRAIKQIIDSGKEYSYNGKWLSKTIPVVVLDTNNSIEEELAILQSNAHNEDDLKEKKRRVQKALELYEKMVPKPIGRKNEWVASITGYSSRSIADYIKELNKPLFTLDELEEKMIIPKEKNMVVEKDPRNEVIKKTIAYKKNLDVMLSKIDNQNDFDEAVKLIKDILKLELLK
ncbi:MAG: ParB/RepB/Spo0J family partition protein [Erysipelotrichaceae bacterium]